MLDDAIPDVECVVVDDGSSDQTAAVVAARAEADPRVVLLRSPANGGVSSARNLGLDAFRGDWLAFLDADDVLLPGGLAAMVDATRDPGVRAVVGQRVWSDGRRRWLTPAYDVADIRQPGRKSLASHPGLVFYASATGKLFHRSTFDGLRFEGRVLGDQPWTLRALLRAGDGIEVIAADVYEWRRPPAEAPTTITAAKRGSARVAAEAALVAIGALADVAAEAEARLTSRSDRDRVVGAYFERLVLSDLEGPMTRALARGDDGAAELFDAVRAFVDAAPDQVVRHSRAIADGLILAPLDYWIGASPGVRSAYLELLRQLLQRHPSISARLRPGLLKLALNLARSGPSWPSWLVTSLLALRWPMTVFRRRRRPRRRFIQARIA